MIRIALCDDIPAHAKAATKLLEMYQKERLGIEFEISIFDNGSKLLEDIIKNGVYDIYLLDIVMPPPDGITLAHQIRKFDAQASLVFLTHTESFAMDAFRVSAVQYLLKPVCKDSLFITLDKIIAERRKQKDRFFTVAAPERTVTLLHSSVVVVEKTGRTLRFHLENGEYVDSKAVRMSFDASLSGLLQDERFLRVHQSFAINMDYVSELRNTMFVMKNGVEITIPRPKFTAVKQAYIKYLSKSNK